MDLGPKMPHQEKGPLPAGGVKKPTAVATYSIVWPVSSSTNVSGGGSRSSVVQERQVEQPEALRVGEYVDLGDLPAYDRDAHHRESRAARGP